MTAIDNAPGGIAATDDTTTVNIVYILYLVGFVTGITALIGVILAYVNRDDASELGRAHFNYQIKIFWRGVILLVAAMVLYLVAGIIGAATIATGAFVTGYGSAGVGLGAMGLGSLIMLVPVALSLYWMVWTIFKVVKGMKQLNKQLPV